MSKWGKINFFCFILFLMVTSSLIYLFGTANFTAPFNKPWHLLPSVHEDSLSQDYLDSYCIYNRKSMLSQVFDSSATNVFVLIDAWGVPIQESKLKEDFSYFERNSHIFAIHQRLGNRNKHAERVEFRGGPENKIYLFGGDSMEYNRPAIAEELGFERRLFCQKCNDEMMIDKIDSLIKNDSLRLIAWTTQSSRIGNRDSLHKSLKLIADFALAHPNVRFVLQGTHRPNLGKPEIRKFYKSHWVPVVILNDIMKEVNSGSI